MNRNELLSQVEKHLIDNQQVSDEAALGLKLLRLTYAELKSPAEAQASSPELLSQLASADRSISTLQDKVADYEGLLYDLLLQVGLLPEVDDEPAISLVVALKEDPECLDKLNNAITDGFGVSNDAVRFIQAVRQLVGSGSDDDMHQVYNELESKAQYLSSLETGIAQRDTILLQADERLQAIRAKLGIPADAHGTFEQTEWPAINLLIEQRQAAQDRLAVGRDETPAEDTLEAIIEQILTTMRIDWQDVETLPDHIKKMSADLKARTAQTAAVSPAVMPLAGWVSDAVDLAHAVRGNLSPENRVMAKAAEQIIVTAPRGEA